jgi:murein DD-endopeptidase MepM/ murein hydrolase activator NlpD
METPPKKRKWSEKLKDHYRFVILNENTLEDVWYAVLSRRNVIIWSGLIGFILVAVGIILVSFTPLREYIPGYPDANIRRLFMYNNLKVDSLEQQLNIRDQYIENIRKILNGQETHQYINSTDSIQNITETKISVPQIDSSLYDQVEQDDRYNIQVSQQKNYHEPLFYDLSKIHFYCPVKGTLTNFFNTDKNHFGIDIVSNLNEPVLSVLDGTVVFAGWTLEAGYVIEVQHGSNLISIYKHNSFLLKKMGERVQGGEPVAIIGNTGEYTTGPHLHFELWQGGKPLNPKDYIIF